MAVSSVNWLCERLGIDWPIIQAPMAGVSTPALAAAVSNAGGLGSIAVGAVDAAGARALIAATRGATNRSINVNVFCHAPPGADAARDAAWLRRLEPEFARFGAAPPPRLNEIYKSFANDDAMLAMLVEERPKVVSFHLGLPAADRVAALRAAGIFLIASVVSPADARAAAALGLDAVVAQGVEAGGHRSVIDPDAPDEGLSLFALTRQLARELDIPVIAAGGVMDGAGIAAALRLGASAAQLGTAFIACPESQADAGYRAALLGEGARHTTVTRAITGRPVRVLANRFTAWGEAIAFAGIPPYPVAYDAGKALNAAAKAKGDYGYGAHSAGQGAPLARALPAAALMAALIAELNAA